MEINPADFEPRSKGGNIKVLAGELAEIRSLEDFDLTMFLSEIHDHGWTVARRTLPMIIKAVTKRGVKGH